jgi:hypothetical protein
MYERGGSGALSSMEAEESKPTPDILEESEDAPALPLRGQKVALKQLPSLQVDPKRYHTDIPLPDVLLRHLKQPSAALQNRNRVTGLRLELNGRLKGSDRWMKQTMQYGKMGTNDVADKHVDYGKSYFISRRGTIGVKVTVGYER